MKLAGLALAAALATTVHAIPIPSHTKAADQTLCGQWDLTISSPYTLYNNLWNLAAGKGSQCTLLSNSWDSGISWKTSWSWTYNKDSVKSYANAVTSVNEKKLKDINNLDSVWSWSYTGDDIIADVAYDMFTAPSTSAANQYEVMIWLASFGGAAPISDTGRPIATPEIAGKAWYLYKGHNGDTTVFSFVAPTHLTDFSANIMKFLRHLVEHQGVPDDQVLKPIGAGTETFTGSNAVFSTSKYNMILS
ncbi:hypothetical protein ANO11243_088520 [Dothideomycetidae sp. 11243]|nr:hypothetical protein ANO11243_088520 [fungal sp. No.11243]